VSKVHLRLGKQSEISLKSSIESEVAKRVVRQYEVTVASGIESTFRVTSHGQ
jgi:hypothetical protein